MDYFIQAASFFFGSFASGETSKKQHNPVGHDLQRQSLHSRDFIRIALLLSQKLPPELVLMILDFAECWRVVQTAISPRSDHVLERHGPKLQAALIIPNVIPRGSIRRVRFNVISRDQGWSDYPQDHGTYRGSWTWFEAGVRGLDPSNEDDQAALQVPVDCKHRDTLSPEHKSLCLQNASYYKHGSKSIVTNIHASRNFTNHVVLWDASHEDEDVREIIRTLKGGHRIEVSAHARFQGWCNHVQAVSIQVECPVVRKM